MPELCMFFQVGASLLWFGTLLQTVLLESRENSAQRVLVATTHLFFHPKANLIRVLQAEVILKHLEELLDSYEAQVC